MDRMVTVSVKEVDHKTSVKRTQVFENNLGDGF